MQKPSDTLIGVMWFAATGVLRVIWRLIEHFFLGWADDRVIALAHNLPQAAVQNLTVLATDWLPPLAISIALLLLFLVARLRRERKQQEAAQPLASQPPRQPDIAIVVAVEQEDSGTTRSSRQLGSPQPPARFGDRDAEPHIKIEIRVRTGTQTN